MTFASSSAACWMIAQASLTSASVRSSPPVTLMRIARAPWIDCSSRSGFEIARCAASTARCSPVAVPVPMSAMPMFSMTVFTSAKSRFTMPGTVMRSLIPCTACRRTSSAMRKASHVVTLRSTKE